MRRTNNHAPARLARLAAFFCALVFVSALVYGQTIKASLSGIVSDKTGGVIAGANVTVKDIDRGVSYTTTSNETGFFLVSELTPGKYEITAEKPGFRTYVVSPVPLQTQQKASLNITLEVGAVSERIEVTGAAQVV